LRGILGHLDSIWQPLPPSISHKKQL